MRLSFSKGKKINMRVKLNLSYNLSKSIPVLIPLPSPLMRLSDYRLITCKNPTTDPVMRYPGLFTYQLSGRALRENILLEVMNWTERRTVSFCLTHTAVRVI